jgi:hypothetical protein
MAQLRPVFLQDVVQSIAGKDASQGCQALKDFDGLTNTTWLMVIPMRMHLQGYQKLFFGR